LRYCKRGLGTVEIGRYLCPSREEPHEEECSFWERLKSESSDVLNAIYRHMRALHVSYLCMSLIMGLFSAGERHYYQEEQTRYRINKKVKMAHV